MIYFKDTTDLKWTNTPMVSWSRSADSVYASYRDELSRKPVQLVVFEVEKCSLTYGTSPCTATGSAGSECYNTWSTCQDLTNYTRTTEKKKYSSSECAPVFSARPYVKGITTLPTRLTTKQTAKARVKVQMLDELSDDIGVDPYVSTRSSVQGEYWKKFIARNPNYTGWSVMVYEGFQGMEETDFVQRWSGKLENITLKKGVATLDTVDQLATLDDFAIPCKTEAELLNSIDASQTSFILTSVLKDDGTEFDQAGYLQIDNEIIQYTSITVASNQINGATRGAFNTTAATHDAETLINLVKYFEPKNPFDTMQDIWDLAGGNYQVDFDTVAWAYWRDWPLTDVDFSAIIIDEDNTTAADLFWEIANILDVDIWQNEEQKISIRRNITNDPVRNYYTVSDSSNIISGSTSTDYNARTRKSRVVMYWGKQVLGEIENVANFDEISVVLDANAESADGYGDIREDIIHNRWLSKRFLQEEVVDAYVASLIRRRLFVRRDAQPIVTVMVDQKDECLLTGGNVVLESDELVNYDGTPVEKNNIIISRMKRGSSVKLELKELPRRRVCFIAPSGHPDYSAASTDQREYGFICDANGDMEDGSGGYYIY